MHPVTMTDALLLAYAAVSYVGHVYGDGNVTVRFVVAKAKVTPTVLGSRLSRKVSELYIVD